MIRFLAAALLLNLPLPAAGDPVEAAEEAAAALSRAAALLDAAENARDRVAALTETIRSYESGLAALRDGIRRASLREQAIRAEFEADEERLSALLGGLLSMQTSPEAVALLHPAGPVDSARAGMIAADVAPAMAARTAALKEKLEELRTIRVLQNNAAVTLRRGVAGVQEARTALAQAISDRAPAPDSSETDSATMQALIEGADTLEGFAASLVRMGDAELGPGAADFLARKGKLPLPVAGTLLLGFEEAGADGVRRPGMTVATAPRALVTAPHPSTLRYAGPLLDQGQVAVLEPAPGTLIILSGLEETFGRAGEVLGEGAPVGLMGGDAPDADQILIETAGGTGQDRSETLYIEVRRDQTPEDPADWFAPAQKTGR